MKPIQKLFKISLWGILLGVCLITSKSFADATDSSSSSSLNSSQQNLATDLDDTFFTFNNLSPACKGESYYKLVEMDAKGREIREVIRYNQKFAYYVASKSDYVDWFLNKGMAKNHFKKLMFVTPDLVDEASPLPPIEGMTVTDQETATQSYNHKTPPEFNGMVAISMTSTPPGKYYFVAPLNPENGIMPVCISGCFNSRAPMSAMVVECFEGTLEMMMLNPSTRHGANGRTVFQLFQSVTRTTVVMIVIAYIALMGIKTFLGEGFAKDGYKTFLFALIKIGFVSYLAIGDGWKDSMFLAYKGIISGASQIMMSSTSRQNYDGCTFKVSDYPRGKEINSIFDSLDCKSMNYIGFFRDQTSPVLANMFVSFLIFPPIVGAIINSLITIYTTTLLNVIAMFVQMYIGSSIYMMILIFISPLTIPTMLFTTSVVKSIFDGWLKMLIGVALNQILTVMLISIFIPLLDSSLYGSNQASMFISAPDDIYDSTRAHFASNPNANSNDLGALLLNDKNPTYPPILTAMQIIKDVSYDCASGLGGMGQLYRPMVCFLRLMNGAGQIAILPYIVTVFTVYLPNVTNIAPLIGTFINAIFLLFIVVNLTVSMEGLIKTFSGNVGGAISSGQANAFDLAKTASAESVKSAKGGQKGIARESKGDPANESKGEGGSTPPK